MNIFMFILAVTLLIFSLLGLYYCSEKQHKKTLTTPYFLLAQYAKLCKLVCYIFIILACVILTDLNCFSIALVSTLVFITPISLFIILFKNKLRS